MPPLLGVGEEDGGGEGAFGGRTGAGGGSFEVPKNAAMCAGRVRWTEGALIVRAEEETLGCEGGSREVGGSAFAAEMTAGGGGGGKRRRRRGGGRQGVAVHRRRHSCEGRRGEDQRDE